MKRALGFLMMAGLAHAGTVVDQIAVIVGKRAIKTSDIDRDLRVTQFLNGESAASTPAGRKAAVQRLIDQELIRNDLASGGNGSLFEDDANAVLNQLLKDRFKGSEVQLNADLSRRGLTKARVLQQVQWQLLVLRFIDQRFRPGVIVSDDEVRDYYNKHAAQFKEPLEKAAASVRETLEEEQVNKNLEEWLSQTRKSTRIEYKLDELTGLN